MSKPGLSFYNGKAQQERDDLGYPQENRGIDQAGRSNGVRGTMIDALLI